MSGLVPGPMSTYAYATSMTQPQAPVSASASASACPLATTSSRSTKSRFSASSFFKMFDFMNSPSPARCWVCWKGDKQSVSNQTHFNVGCPECCLEQQCISALYPEPILKSHETGRVHMFTLPNTQECSFGRVGVRRSTSERNGRYYLPILSAWLDDCIKNHSECASPNSQLPTRVLDIGTSTLDPVRLYLTTQEHGRYIALSHCWGTDGLNQVQRRNSH
jgi:hypothetical protein